MTPSFINTASTLVPNRFGWDGRATSLEEQSLRPVTNPAEMGNSASQMVHTLDRIEGYASYFDRAFGDRSITVGACCVSACRLPAHADERKLRVGSLGAR